MKSSITFNLNFTLSKLLAYLIVGASVWIDIHNGNANAFMLAVPFAASLVLGKQYLDSKTTIATSTSATTQSAPASSPMPPATTEGMV